MMIATHLSPMAQIAVECTARAIVILSDSPELNRLINLAKSLSNESILIANAKEEIARTMIKIKHPEYADHV